MKKDIKFKIKIIFLLLILLIMYITTCVFSYTSAVCADIADSVFRLHVIANSDTGEDQNLKHVVRDNVLKYMNTFLSETNSKEEAMQLIENHSVEIEAIATQTIIDCGYNYDINISIGNFAFPTKQYGDIMLPPGYYDALKIEIGNAEGQNWWCVMFPPLCFIDTSSGIVPEESKEIMKENLTSEEYSLISESNINMEIKFKFVEMLQNLAIRGIFM